MQFQDLLFVIVTVYLLYRYRASRRRRLPPGPRGYPLIGNLYDIPPREEWMWYKALSEKYQSDIVYLNILGTPLIVVNTFQAADELFVKRSAIYSDRPRFAPFTDLLGWTWHFAFMKYGEAWRGHRVLFRKVFQPPALYEYTPQILGASRTLLQRLLASPENFDSHLRHMAGTVILSSAYGIDPLPSNDPYVSLSERAVQTAAAAGNPTTFLVDYLPWMRYIPGDWGYKSKARAGKELAESTRRIPMEFVKVSMEEGTAKPSIASRNLQEMHDEGTWTPEREEVLSDVLGAMYAAGADTTVSSLETFILAMVLYPDVQKKGQVAVDAVTGKDRLPDLSDHQGCSIPYIDAIVKETFRWKQVLPLAMSHSNTIDDAYNGYFIPAGSIVIGNSWAMLHDTTEYGPDPEVFRPERFMKDDNTLDPDVRNPDVAFGFGRRTCAGQIMAEMSVWVTIASILASFDIVKAVDKKGEPIVPEEKYTSGMLCYPEPFKCSIHPRSGVASDLINESRVSEGV